MAYFYRRHGATSSSAVTARPMSTRASGAAGKGKVEGRGSVIRLPVTLAARNDCEQEEQVLCDPCFIESINHAISPTTDLKTAVYLICSQPSMIMRSKSKLYSR